MSVPIPRSSRSSTTLPHIDDVMQMPFTVSPPPLPRPRLSSSPLTPPPLPALSTSVSSLRNARPYALAHQHSHPRAAPSIIQTTPVQPRVISFQGSWAEVACSSPVSPRTRRPSSGAPGPASLSLHPPSVHPTRVSPHWHPHAPTVPPPPPQPFPRPSYLDHSLLRDLLQTELPIHLHQQLVTAPLPPPPPQPAQSTHVHTPAILRTPSPGDSEDDRSPSPPLRRAATSQRTQPTMIGSTPIFRLPTRWSEQDRHPYLSVSTNGRDLTYNGNGFGSTQPVDAGLARANHPIPPACGIYYFEIEVLSKSQKAQVSVGFTTKNPRLNKLPGWEKESWGYYGDDGQAYTVPPEKEVKLGQPFGQPFGGGDVIGAGIDFTLNRAFFTKNGMLVGYVFDNIGINTDPQIFPSIGLRHVNEHIQVNFGHMPFRYDIDEHAQGARDTVWGKIQRQPLDWRKLSSQLSTSTTNPAIIDAEGDVKMDVMGIEEQGERNREELGKLVLGYLIHHGYAKSAMALEQQLAREAHKPTHASLPLDNDEEDGDKTTTPLSRRLAVLRAVLAGDIDTALDRAEMWFPGVLDAHGGRVRLKLRCRKFVELVNGAAAIKRHIDSLRNSTPPLVGGVDVDGMDVDADSNGGTMDGAVSEREKGEAEVALKKAIAYGQQLRAEYKKDPRNDVQEALDQAFAVVVYHFPSETKGEVGRWAGREGREALAAEVNEAILESQGHPRHPALERAYRQTVAMTVQLGYQGVGAGVYADVRRELLDG